MFWVQDIQIISDYTVKELLFHFLRYILSAEIVTQWKSTDFIRVRKKLFMKLFNFDDFQTAMKAPEQND